VLQNEFVGLRLAHERFRLAVLGARLSRARVAISMAPTAGGATTSVSLVGGEAKSYAPRGFLYRERGRALH